MVFCQLSQAEFSEHCRQVGEKSFFQSEEMCMLLTKRGYDVRLVGYKNSQSEVVISSLLFCTSMVGGLYMELNAGPLITEEAYLGVFYQSLTDYAKREGVLELVIKPAQTYQVFDGFGKPIGQENARFIELLESYGFQHDGLQTGYPNGEPVWHYVKDLEGLSQASLTDSFSKKGKTLSKKANSFGLKVTRLSRNQLFRFQAITALTSKERGYEDKTLAYYQDFFDSFGEQADFLIASINFYSYLDHLEEQSDRLQLRIAELSDRLRQFPQSKKKQNELRELMAQLTSFEQRKCQAQQWIEEYGTEDVDIAASLFVYSRRELVYLFSGSRTEFGSFYAPILLQEFAMRHAVSLSLPFYNLLGIQGNFDGSDGVLRFKQNFNGYILRKAGTFRYYPYPIRHKILQIIKNIVK